MLVPLAVPGPVGRREETSSVGVGKHRDPVLKHDRVYVQGSWKHGGLAASARS